MAYSANRGNGNMPYNQEEISPEQAKQQEASKKALKTGAKAAATYFAGPVGGMAVDKIANTELGDKILNEGANKINKIPGMAQKTEMLNDSGATDLADKAIDVAGAKSPASSGAGASSGAANSLDDAAKTGDSLTNPASSTNVPGGSNPNPLAQSSKSDNNSGDSHGDEESEEGSQGESSGGEIDGSQIIASAQKVAKISVLFAPVAIFIFIILIIVTALGGETGDYDDALAASAAAGKDTGGYNYEVTDPKAKAFYDRINSAKSSMESEGEEMDIAKLVAVYHIINRRDSKYDYDYFTTPKLREIARQITRDREETKENLATNIFPKYFPDNSYEDNMAMAEEVYEYIDAYNSMLGITEEEYDDYECTGGTGVCTYDIKGFNIGGKIYKKSLNISDLQVRLMQCGSPYGKGSYTTAINQSLVAFENYVTGVSYAEVGAGYPKAAQQAQMIAARSFALARPTAMNNSLGKKLGQENGKWILQISSCVADQVFCNIDQGCSYTGGGDGQGGYVVSGTGKGERSTAALASNSTTRTYANEVQGMVLVDKSGYVVYTNYTSTEQKQMNSLAGQNLDYKQILLKMYPNATKIYKANCGADTCSASTGEYSKWLQYKGSWASVPMGNSGKTVGQIGCLVTSISMLIAKSGVPTPNVDKPFNPGTFVKALNKNNGFDSTGNFQWYTVNKVVPNFKFVGKYDISGYTKDQKLNRIKELVSNGYAVVAEVKGNTGEHWVAIDGVNGSKVLIMDPSTNATDLWAQYNWQNTSTLAFFKIYK